MIKKVSILTLLLLFFISTTGLPVTIHLCNMESSKANQSCPVYDMMKKMHQSCNQDQEENSYFSVENGNCCKIELVNKSISDKFLQIDSQKHNLKLNFITPAMYLDLFADYNISASLSNYFSDSSPPSLINNHIYLDNSILLI